MLYRDAVRAFLLERRRRGLSPATLVNYERILGEDLYQALGDRALEGITLDDLRQWVDEKYDRGLRVHSIWSYIVVAQAFFTWCVEEGLLDKSPAARLRRPRLPRPLPRALSEREVALLLRAARQGKNPERDEALILFLLDSGARRGAVARLTLDDIDWAQGVARAWTKGGRQVFLFFGPETARALRRWLAVRRPDMFADGVHPRSLFGLKPSGLRQVFRRLRERAGIQARVSPHILRHTSAVLRVEAGIDASTLAQIMGWTTIRMAEVHTRMSLRRLRRRADQTSPVSSIRQAGLLDDEDTSL